MTLTQLFNLAPTPVDAGRLPAPGRGRAATGVDVDFEQTLQQSRQQWKRSTPRDVQQAPASSREREATASSEGDELRTPDERKQANMHARVSNEQPADRSDESAQTDATPMDDSRVAHEEAVTETVPIEDEIERTEGKEQEAGEEGDALIQLLASLRQWMTQQPTDTGDVMEEASPEDIEALTEMLTRLASSDEVQELLVKAGPVGNELVRMMQQLATQGTRPSRMADPLAALMAMTPGSGRPVGQSGGAFNAMDFASVAPAAEGDAPAGKAATFGQMFAQAVPALSSMLQGGGQSSGQAGDLQALLSQLVTATSTSQSGQGTPASELLTALMQGGAQPTQPTGQGTTGALTPSTPGPSSAGDVDAQAANASRVARAMQGAVNQGGGTMTLRMTPPELGTVRIQLQVQAGTVNAALHAESEGARTLLSQQLSQLRQSLEGQGLHVERLSVQSMTGNQSANASQQDQSDATPDDGRSRDEYRGSGQRQGEQHDERDGEPGASEPAAFEQVLGNVTDT